MKYVCFSIFLVMFCREKWINCFLQWIFIFLTMLRSYGCSWLGQFGGKKTNFKFSKKTLCVVDGGAFIHKNRTLRFRHFKFLSVFFSHSVTISAAIHALAYVEYPNGNDFVFFKHLGFCDFPMIKVVNFSDIWSFTQCKILR